MIDEPVHIDKLHKARHGVHKAHEVIKQHHQNLMEAYKLTLPVSTVGEAPKPKLADTDE